MLYVPARVIRPFHFVHAIGMRDEFQGMELQNEMNHNFTAYGAAHCWTYYNIVWLITVYTMVEKRKNPHTPAMERF